MTVAQSRRGVRPRTVVAAGSERCAAPSTAYTSAPNRATATIALRTSAKVRFMVFRRSYRIRRHSRFACDTTNQRGRRSQQVRTAEIEDELYATIGDDVLLGRRGVLRFVDPETLDRVLENRVWLVLSVFHLARRHDTSRTNAIPSLRKIGRGCPISPPWLG